jgi:hypothetical protein
MLVEAAWTLIRSPGPLRPFGERVRARRGAQIAAVSVARKLTVLCWHLLSKDQGYAFARPSLARQKTRRLELAAGAPPLPRGRKTRRPSERPKPLLLAFLRGFQRRPALSDDLQIRSVWKSSGTPHSRRCRRARGSQPNEHSGDAYD